MESAAAGKTDAARANLAALQAEWEAMPETAKAGNNSGADVVNVAALVLQSRVALASGDANTALVLYETAVAAEDALAYDEPPGWYIPVRESLGGALLTQRRFADAERVFRDDLARHPKNPRSLFGLHQALKAQDKKYAAFVVEKEFETAWKNADTVLKIEDLY